VLKSHFWKIILTAVVFGVLALVGSLIAPKKYEGFIQILIDQKPLQASPPQNPSQSQTTDYVEFMRPRAIVTQVQQLTGFQVLGDAGKATADALGVPEDKRDEFGPENMRENVSVDAEVGSDVITLRVRMSEPEYAKEFAGQAYDQFVKQNERTTRELAGRATNVLEMQMNSVKKELDSIDTATRALREKYAVPDLDRQIQAEILQIGKLRDYRDVALIDLNTATERLAGLERELRKTPKEFIASTTDQFNSNILAIESAIAVARADRAQAMTRYEDDHEIVRGIDLRITQLQKEMRQIKAMYQGQVTRAQNPTFQTLTTNATDLRGSLPGLEARLSRSQQELDRAESRLLEFPMLQRKLLELQREQAAKERLFLALSDQYESLRVLPTGRTNPTRMITEPSALQDPVTPKPLINTLIGVIVGFIVGFVWMLRSEAKNLPIRSINQLNALALEPVYRIIPELRAPFRGLAKTPPEAYETLIVNCLKTDKRPYRVAVVGVTRETGASTTVLNYAVSAHRRGLKCVVVSSDPRSSIRRMMSGPPPDPGGKTTIQDTFEFMNFVDQIIVSGEKGTTRIASSIAEAEQDVTLFDLEPTLVSADYVILAQHVDEVILLVRADRVKTVEYLTAQQALTDAGCPRVTVVFARTPATAVVTDQITYPEELRALPS